jgi:hypothetical protein
MMARRIFALVALVVALVALISLNRLSANWHYIVPAEPGALLYAAAFDDLEDEWERYEGRLSAVIADGRLRLTVGDFESGPYSVAKPYFGDFDLRLEATAVDGPLDNGFGVIFRLQDRQNYYLFLISSDGYYKVERVSDGIARELSTWIESPLVRQGLGVSNQLRVIGRGDQFSFAINGEPVGLCIPDDPEARSTYAQGTCVNGSMQPALTDASIASGRLGVVATSFSASGVVVNFDNVLVYGPQPAVD